MEAAWQMFDRILEHGDQRAICYALNLAPSLVHGWRLPPEREGGEGKISPIERSAEIVETLRRNGNANADEPFRWLGERLGFVVVNVADIVSPTCAEFAEVCRHFADVARQHADNIADGRESLDERVKLRKELRELIESATAMDLHLAQEIDAESRRPDGGNGSNLKVVR